MAVPATRLTTILTCLTFTLGETYFKHNFQHASEVYPAFGQNPARWKTYARGKQAWFSGHLSDPYAQPPPQRHHEDHVQYVDVRQRRDNMFGNFDPNQFNSQIGSSFNPNSFSGGGSTSGNMFNMMSGTSGGMSMFNPNAMMGGGGGTTSTSGGSTSGTSSAQQASGSSGTSGGFDPNAASGTSSGTSGQTSGGTSAMLPQGGTTGGNIPSYDPNNLINTGAKYDPNAANSGPGTGGSAPSFASGMGFNASQNVPAGANNFAIGGAGGGGATSGSTGGASSGSALSGSNPASSFGSSSNQASSFGSSSGSASSFGSSSSGMQTGGTSSTSGSTQTGSGSQTSAGTTGGATGGGSMTGGPMNNVPPGTSGSTSGGGTGGPNFDPIATNSMATSGFNPLNPMLGKDMSVVMGPQAQSGGSNFGNFDPSKMNAQLGQQGMSLNMFGGAGGNTNLNNADAGAVMNGAQGMLAGSNAIKSGGNAVMTGGNSAMGTGMGGSSATGTSGTSAGSTTGGSTTGGTFDPNQMSSGSGGSMGGSSTGGTFDPNQMSSGSGGGTSGSGTSASTSGSSGGMNIFDPNAMMGGGSTNPMMPGGNMNPMMPGGGGMNPMMPGGNMMGSSTGTRGSSSTGTNPAQPAASPLDPLGAMTGGAKNFSGGNNLMDPMGFMGGGGLTGGMTNMFSMSGRAVPLQTEQSVHRRDNNLMKLLTRNEFYNPMDPLGFIFQGRNEQYKEGNGGDTPRYNPDYFAFAYTGSKFGSGPNPFVPQLSSSSINNSPNYGSHTLDSTKQENVHSNKTSTNSTNEATDEPFSNLPVVAGMSLNAAYSSYTDETFPNNVMSALHMNVSSMFPEAVFSGQPGMLGVGSQLPVQVIRPEQSPLPGSQYIPSVLRNVSETVLSLPAYNGYPGMVGVGEQSLGNVQTDTDNPNLIYNGYPGMLGATKISGNRTNTSANSDQSQAQTAIQDKGYSNNEQTAYPGQANYFGRFIEPVPGINTNNWNGEWPGKTSAGGDWSGDWSEKWPGNKEASEATTLPTTAESKGFGISQSNQHSGSQTGWDGSWPGSSGTEPKPRPISNKVPDNLSDTMATLEKLLAMLDKVSLPPALDNSQKEETTDKGASRSFSALAAGWKDDMKS